MSIASAEPSGPAKKSRAQIDYEEIRHVLGTKTTSLTKNAIVALMGPGWNRRRVRHAIAWGQNNDRSINIGNALSSAKNHKIDGDPLNGYTFTPEPTRRGLEGLKHDLKHIKTRCERSSSQFRTASVTETDPIKKRLLERSADQQDTHFAEVERLIEDIDLLIASM